MANNTVTGALELISTFHSIGVYASFSGDDNGDNYAMMEYRPQGFGVWLLGAFMVPDRRQYIGGAANPYYKQWRASLVGLIPNTIYEVKITFSDFDGVTGTNPIIGVVATRNDNFNSVSFTGASYYVDTDDPVANDSNPGTEALPFKTIHQAVGFLQPGDTVNVKAGGTYAGSERLTISAEGNSTNYVTVRSYGTGAKPIIDASNFPALGGYGNIAPSIHIRGSFLRVIGFETRGGNCGVYIGPTSSPAEVNPHDVVLERCIVRDRKTLSSSPSKYHGVMVGGRSEGWHTSMARVTIQDNQIYIVEPGGTSGGNTSGPAVYFLNACGGHVVRYNEIRFTGTCSGHGMDGINNSPNFMFSYTMKDTDLYGNYIEGATDDAISLDGNGANVRVWENKLVRANMAVSAAPILIGPAYIFRNQIFDGERHWVSTVATHKGGEGGTGFVFYYHNDVILDSRDVGVRFPGGSGKVSGQCAGFYNSAGDGDNSRNVISRNNIMLLDGAPVIDYTGRPDMDFDLIFNKFTYSTSYWAKYGGNSIGSRSNSNAQNMATFNAATGQEVHGVAGEPIFVNKEAKDFRLAAGSPGISRGVVIQGFNDKDSAWPYVGDSPDIGAIESSGATAVYSLTIGAMTGGTTIPTPGTHQYNSGVQISIVAVPDTGYSFVGWREGGAIVSTDNPVTLLMNNDRTITAVFELTTLTQYSITIAAGVGGTTDPPPGDYQHDSGAVIGVTAIPVGDYNFVGWQESGILISTDNPISILMNEDISITAIFETSIPPTAEYALAISVVGSGTTVPVAGVYTVQEGSAVTISAVPSSGHQLKEWQEGGVVISTQNPITITINQDRSITAVFEEIIVPPDHYSLVISVIGQGTTAPTAGSYSVPQGQILTVTATPNAGYKLDHWEGDLSSTDPSITFQLNSNVSITAVFVEELPSTDLQPLIVAVVTVMMLAALASGLAIEK